MNHIEADREWEIPLVNDKITIGQILHRIDSIDSLLISHDRCISFTYDMVRNDRIKASDFLKIDDRQIEGPDNIRSITPLSVFGYDTVPIQSDIIWKLNSDLFKIKHCLIKSGTLVFNFISNSSWTFIGEFSTDQIKFLAGYVLTIPISNHSGNLNINLAAIASPPKTVTPSFSKEI